MHIHEVAFQVVNRQDIVIDEENGTVQVAPTSTATPPGPGRTAGRTPSSPTRAR